MFPFSKRSSLLIFLVSFIIVLPAFGTNAGGEKKPVSKLEPVEKAYNLILERYVSPDSVEKRQLIIGAIEGMLEQLPDPHDQVYTEEGYKKHLRKVVRSNYFGVGVILGDRGKYVSVLETFPFNSAARNGVKPRDVILEIDGESTVEMNYREAGDLLRGEQEDEVTLKVKHPNGEREKITLRKIPVQIPAVEHELLRDGRIGLIDVNYFREDVEWRVNSAINELENEDLQGFILDLRNNRGGVLKYAFGVASKFVDSGIITKFHKKDRVKKYSTEGNATPNLPLVVLINERTASASELIAAAVRYHDMGVLAGRRSYGKQYGQSFFELEGDLYLALSTINNFFPEIPEAGLKPELKSPNYWKDVEIAKKWINKHAGEKTPLGN